MNKGLKITIGILTLGVTGFGIYMLYKKVLKPKIQAKKDAKEALDKKEVGEEDVKKSSYNRKSTGDNSEGKTPFKNATEGNAFRKWVNDNHAQYASRIDLDPTGAYDNAFIRKAWVEYGSDYEKVKKSSGAVYTATFGQNFANLLKSWNKSHLLSNSTSTKDVPYFKLNTGVKSVVSFAPKFACIYDIYVYDRKLGESVGGKNGKGYWKVVRRVAGSSKSSSIAWGTYNKYLNNLTVTGGKNKGKTYSGGKTAPRFSEIIMGDTTSLVWC